MCAVRVAQMAGTGGLAPASKVIPAVLAFFPVAYALDEFIHWVRFSYICLHNICQNTCFVPNKFLLVS